jgi:hypothetical protein
MYVVPISDGSTIFGCIPRYDAVIQVHSTTHVTYDSLVTATFRECKISQLECYFWLYPKNRIGIVSAEDYVMPIAVQVSIGLNPDFLLEAVFRIAHKGNGPAAEDSRS